MAVSTPGGTGFNTQGEFLTVVSPGILVSLSLFTPADLEQSFQTYAEIGVKSTDKRLQSRRVQLATGYLREEQGLTWTGFYPLHTGDFIYMFLRGNLDPVFELIDRRLTSETTIIPGVTLADLLRATA